MAVAVSTVHGVRAAAAAYAGWWHGSV
eukprot:SAG11_NODE_3173_length_2635_cov_1.511435_1_plen_26_part_10